MNFFDTSDLYGFGHAEELLGDAFPGRRDEVVIASKGGFLSFDGKQDFSSDHLLRALEGSLQRLKTDRIDLYQLHSPLFTEMNDEVFEVLSKMKSSGKIRSIGVSVRSPEEGLLFLDRYSFDVMQVNFNFVDQRALEIGLIDRCNARNVGVIVRTPLAFGFLTGKYLESENFAEGDHRKKWSSEQKSLWAKGSELFTREISEKTGQSPAQIALRFCLSFDGISSTIPGMLIPEHVDENAQGGDLGRFSAEDLSKFKEIYTEGSFFTSK